MARPNRKPDNKPPKKGKRSLRGKGPTPKAEDRPYHKKYQSQEENQRKRTERKRLDAKRGDAKRGAVPLLRVLELTAPFPPFILEYLSTYINTLFNKIIFYLLFQQCLRIFSIFLL